MPPHKLQILILLPLLVMHKHHCLIRLSKIACDSIDPQFSKFNICEIKPDTGKAPAISIFIRLLQLPINNCLIHIELFYLSLRGTPSLVNGTWDACQFLNNGKRFRSFARLYESMSNYTNMNHSCPYNHDVYMHGFAPSRMKTPVPVPRGEYILRSVFTVDREQRVAVNVSFKIT